MRALLTPSVWADSCTLGHLVRIVFRAMDMKRREFIALLAGATASKSSAWGQATLKIRGIGVLQSLSPDGARIRARVRALKEGLEDTGWLEGRNIAFELRSANGRMERLPELAAELVAANVDVIVTAGVELVANRRKRFRISTYRDALGRRCGSRGLYCSPCTSWRQSRSFTLVASEQSTKRFEFMKAIVPDL